MNIKNKVVVITGGARGIGLALGKRFLLEKPKTIILVDLNFDDLELNNNDFVCKKCDVTDEISISLLIDEVNQKYGLIDIFVLMQEFYHLVMNRYQLKVGTETGIYMLCLMH